MRGRPSRPETSPRITDEPDEEDQEPGLTDCSRGDPAASGAVASRKDRFSMPKRGSRTGKPANPRPHSLRHRDTPKVFPVTAVFTGLRTRSVLFPVEVAVRCGRRANAPPTSRGSRVPRLTNPALPETIGELHPRSTWACGAAGSALPWHGRGHRFDPDQVHQELLS